MLGVHQMFQECREGAPNPVGQEGCKNISDREASINKSTVGKHSIREEL